MTELQTADAQKLNDTPALISVFGVIDVPNKHANLLFNVTTVFTILYLLDFFFDKNPLKSFWKELFPGDADPDNGSV